MDPDEQRRLVEKARAGDADAWELLYRNAYSRLRAYAARHGGPAVAEDLVSEAMTRAVAGIGKFEWRSAGFDAWLIGILRRVCADHYRRKGRGANTAPFRPLVEEWQPGELLDLNDDHAEVRKAFEQLSGPEREVLELRVIADLSAEEAATVLGKRPGTVRTAQSRALAHLRILMDQSQ